MVESLIRLKLRLLGNTYKRSGWALAGTVIAGLYGLGLVGLVVTTQFVEGARAESAMDLLIPSVVVSTGVTLVWIIVPLAMTGGDSVMDPRQLITFGIPRRSLVIGLSAARMISVGAILTVLWLVGQVLLWRSDLMAAVIAILSVPLLLVTFTAVSQAVTTAASAWLSARKWRDLLAILGLGLAMMAFPIVSSAVSVFENVQEALPVIAEVLSWTPLAAGAALPYDAATGAWGAFGLRLLIQLATLGAALLMIRAALITITEKPRGQGGQRRSAKRGNIGLFGLFPATPWGAVAARSLTYWLKDPRYGGSLIVVPGLAVLGLFLWWQSGETWTLYALGPFIAWMLGYAISADISYDNTAFALHVTTGVTGVADRTGRAVSLLTFSLPVTLAVSVLPMLAVGNVEHLLVVTALSLGMLLSTIGLSSVISARLVYPTPKPGDSPFKQPEGAGGRMMAIQMATMLLTAAVMIPDVVLLILWAVNGAGWLLGLLVAATVLKGVGLVVAGIVLGARVYERAAPELFQEVAAH
ncbi:transporter [Nesterenkonia rhizosphaerae]|uniref:ABC-2 type transport system permease protein n=1 Tax=Nesterenkonia rhizosphaerae TaxID=1348272 RepID=A0ABP9G4P6_9MICC